MVFLLIALLSLVAGGALAIALGRCLPNYAPKALCYAIFALAMWGVYHYFSANIHSQEGEMGLGSGLAWAIAKFLGLICVLFGATLLWRLLALERGTGRRKLDSIIAAGNYTLRYARKVFNKKLLSSAVAGLLAPLWWTWSISQLSQLIYLASGAPSPSMGLVWTSIYIPSFFLGLLTGAAVAGSSAPYALQGWLAFMSSLVLSSFIFDQAFSAPIEHFQTLFASIGNDLFFAGSLAIPGAIYIRNHRHDNESTPV
jgi:hypothetical protein